jgi:hypothetical protein
MHELHEVAALGPDKPALGLDPDCRRGYRRCCRETEYSLEWP